jgi:hypothetical protein
MAAARSRASSRGAHSRAPLRLAREQVEEDRHAEQGGEHADRQLLRGDHGARQGVGHHQQGAAGQRGGGQQHALVVADCQAHQVRHDEADEADAAGGGHRHGGEQRAQGIHGGTQAAHLDAQRACHQVAAREQVEVARDGHHQGQADRRHGQRRPGRAGVREVAHQPEQHAVQLLFRRQREDQGDTRAAAGGDDNPGQQQAALRPTAVAARQAEDREHRRQGTGEGAAVHKNQRQTEQHRRERADRRAAGNTEHIGVGQRVPQQHLHQGAGQRQQGAAGEGGQRARQAQAEHDVGAGAAAAVADKSRQDFARRDRIRADQQRTRQAQQARCEQHGNDEEGAAAARHAGYCGA